MRKFWIIFFIAFRVIMFLFFLAVLVWAVLTIATYVNLHGLKGIFEYLWHGAGGIK